MPGTAGARFRVCFAEVPAEVCTVTSTVPLVGSSVGTRTLICPELPANAKIGTAVVPNSTLTPFELVAGNAAKLFCDPKFAPKTDTIDPGATVLDDPKLAPFTTDPTAGAVPTGRLSGRLDTPATVTITGSIPRATSFGIPK